MCQNNICVIFSLFEGKKHVPQEVERERERDRANAETASSAATGIESGKIGSETEKKRQNEKSVTATLFWGVHFNQIQFLILKH